MVCEVAKVMGLVASTELTVLLDQQFFAVITSDFSSLHNQEI
tara:strand:- start:1149 stop:1274 length:126 start_codon:yes stop_codon:yes gene_type:complete